MPNPYVKSAILRFGIYCIGVIVAVAIGTVLFWYSINRREVRAAQQMMEDARQLRPQTSGFGDALAFSRKYRGEANGRIDGQPCIESDCLITVAPGKNDFWERHPKLGYAASRMSRRGWHFTIFLWVKDGRLTAIQQWFGYSAPTVSPFVITEVSQPSPGLCRNPFYLLHHTFAAYPGPKHFNIWVRPTATQEKEMLRLNFECVLRMSGCTGVSDMVPLAWRAYEADRQVIEANESNRWEDAVPECR